MSDIEDRQLLQDAVNLGTQAREQLFAEAHAGKRTLDFNEIRKLDMDILTCKRQLSQMQ